MVWRILCEFYKSLAVLKHRSHITSCFALDKAASVDERATIDWRFDLHDTVELQFETRNQKLRLSCRHISGPISICKTAMTVYYSINIGHLVLQAITLNITKNLIHVYQMLLARIKHVLTQYFTAADMWSLIPIYAYVKDWMTDLNSFNLTTTSLSSSFSNFATGSSAAATGLQSSITNLFSTDERNTYWSIVSNLSFRLRMTDIPRM